MSKQLIIYDKESGVISRVMLFSYEAEKLSPEQLGLDKNFDLSKTGILIESDKRFINIKKDRIINGILTQPQARKELEKKELSKISSVSIFDDVNYAYLPEHVALITTWNKQCGISNYSRDLVGSRDNC